MKGDLTHPHAMILGAGDHGGYAEIGAWEYDTDQFKRFISIRSV